MKTIKQILIDRDGMSESGADDLIRADWFGLEPDYLMELL